MYRICKTFEFQAAHVLSRHPGRCQHLHGHTYRVEVVLAAETLDENDMVCDFNAIKVIVGGYLDTVDHALFVNSADTESRSLARSHPRIVEFQNQDPSSEVIARHIFDYIEAHLKNDAVTNGQGITYKLNPNARIESVKVFESSTAWAQYRR